MCLACASTGCVDGHRYSAVDVPDYPLELAPAARGAIAVTAVTLYPNPQRGISDTTPRASREVPLPAGLDFFPRQVARALGTQATELGQAPPKADWYVSLFLEARSGLNFGFCLILPCVLADQINLELRAEAIRQPNAAQAPDPGFVERTYRRRIYRRGVWSFAWHRLWRDEEIGPAGSYERAYRRVVDDMLRELVADLEATQVLPSRRDR